MVLEKIRSLLIGDNRAKNSLELSYQYVIKAENAFKAREYSKALEYVHNAIEFNPHNVDAYVIQGCALERKGNSLIAAISFQKALEIDPKCIVAHLQLGYVCHVYENFKGALEYFTEAIKYGAESHAAYFWQASAAFYESDYNISIDSLLIAFEIEGVYKASICRKLGHIADRLNMDSMPFSTAVDNLLSAGYVETPVPLPDIMFESGTEILGGAVLEHPE